MDGSVIDRIAKNLAEHAPRRETLRALVGGSLIVAAGSLDAEQVAGKKKKNKKKRERKLGQTCGGKKKCSKKPGAVSCEPFGDFVGNQECGGVELTGTRCCGQEGAKCDPNFGEPGSSNPETFGNCSCCDPFFCGRQLNGEFRCQDEDT